MNTAYIGLGSNLGDRFDNLCRAVRAVSSITAVIVDAVSAVYETAPVGGPPQGPYLNAAAALRTDIEPETLLSECLAIEQHMGRERRERWGPRIIDIDMLLFGDRIIADANLTIPHPRLTERGFVLYPLAEIAAEMIHPVCGITISELRDRVNGDGIIRCKKLRLETCIRKVPEDER